MQIKSTGSDLATTFAARAQGGAEGQGAARASLSGADRASLAGADRASFASAERGAGFAALLRQSQSAAAPVQAPIAPPAQPPRPAAAPPAPRPPTAKPPTGAASNRAADAAPGTAAADAVAEPSAAPASTETGDAAATPSTPADGARTLLRAKLRAGDGGAAAKAGKAALSDAAQADAAALGKMPPGDDEALLPTDLATAASAALPMAPPAAPPLPAAASRPEAPGREPDAAADAGRPAPRLADALAARQDAAAPGPDSVAANAAASTAASRPPVAAGAGFAAVLAETRSVAAEAPSRDTAVDNNVAPAALQSGAFGPAPAAGTAAAPAVAVPTPVASPDFAQHLGVQLSVLARQGVQQAELQLNPADMGPVSVQITLDGTQARIDFGADVAATRQAIEAGLPQLAGALADAGFTLAGGGVSQHAGSGAGAGGRGDGSPRGDGRGDGRGTGATADDAGGTAVPNAGRRTVRIGGLDLYA